MNAEEKIRLINQIAVSTFDYITGENNVTETSGILQGTLNAIEIISRKEDEEGEN